MLEFSPGESRTAIAPMSNPTAKVFSYTAELYLGLPKAASSGVIPFSLAPGETRSIRFPVTMPAVEGTFPVYLDAYAEGILIGAYQATEDAVIVSAALVGRIGKWSYSVTVSYPTLHRREGEWPDHSLDFDFDLYPSTFFIDFRCYNDSGVEVKAKAEIVATNATIHNQPRGIFVVEPEIAAGSSHPFSFSMGLPRTPGEYYFDAVLSFDGVVVDEGSWVIKYF